MSIPNVDASNERGLQTVTFEPDFATNGYVYYTTAVAGKPSHNRVSRFTATGDVAVAGSEKVLIEFNDLVSSGWHHGGGLVFSGGKLFISTGENNLGSNAQSLNTLLGKVLGINPDDFISTDNPLYATATGSNCAIWVLGFRNPFRAAVQPGTGRVFINDVGGDFEEVNDVAAAGGKTLAGPAFRACGPLRPRRLTTRTALCVRPQRRGLRHHGRHVL